MKKFLMFAVLILVAMSAWGQSAHIVHYDNADTSTKMPDLKGAVVAINFEGPLAQKTKAVLMKKGVRDFSEGSTPCLVRENVICVSYHVDSAGTSSGYGASNGFGTKGGYSDYSSFSGQMYLVTLSAQLIRHDGGGTIELGTASILTGAGSGNETVSSFGRKSSGSLTSGGSNSVPVVIGDALGKDINRMFDPSFKHAIFDEPVRVNWFPGAGSAVKTAFPKK